MSQPLFSFSSFMDWVNKAASRFKGYGVRSEQSVCLDTQGRICRVGADFMLARDEDAFPVRVYDYREVRLKVRRLPPPTLVHKPHKLVCSCGKEATCYGQDECGHRELACDDCCDHEIFGSDQQGCCPIVDCLEYDNGGWPFYLHLLCDDCGYTCDGRYVTAAEGGRP